MGIKKLIPVWIKKLIKENMNVASTETTAKYVLKIDNLKRLEGLRVIVTGATGAIGSAICHRLILEGANVGLLARDSEKLRLLIERFENEFISSNYNYSGEMIPLIADVTNDNQIEAAFNEFKNKTGGIDVIINNAGGSARENSCALYEQDMSVVDSVLDINLRGSILCAKKAAEVMHQQKHGKIINMSSVVGICGKAKMTDYAAAKAGILGFTKALALEMGEYNVTVNCISPGMVNQQPFDLNTQLKITNKNCLKHFGYTDDVADLVAFLASDESNYITGHNFVIDGGRSLGLKGD